MKLKHVAVSLQIATLIVMSVMLATLMSMEVNIARMTEAMFEENPYIIEGKYETTRNR